MSKTLTLQPQIAELSAERAYMLCDHVRARPRVSQLPVDIATITGYNNILRRKPAI